MAKTRAQGSKLHRESDTPGTWEQIPGIVDFSDFGGSTAEISATDLDSIEQEFEPDLPDPGNASLTMMVDLTTESGKAKYSELVTDQQDGVTRRYTLELPTKIGTNRFMVVNAFVSNTPISGGVGAMIQSAFGLRLTGARSFETALPAA